jgi:hypothetical protein
VKRRVVLALAVVAVLVTLLVPAHPATGARSSGGGPSHAPLAAPGVTAASRPAATTQCPTPQNLADWTSSNFFDDVLVTFTVPGYANLSGTNFGTVPCTNALPTYLAGFWMNVSTNVPLVQAYLNIWGTEWPTPTQPNPDLPGFPFDTGRISQLPMYIAPGFPDQASFYFNTYRYFFPGSTVYFNVTLDSSVGTPSTINSANTAYRQEQPSGSNLNATWKFSLDAPWWSPSFSNDIVISTTPPVLGGAVYDPNANQSLSVGLESLGPTGAPGAPIPAAEMDFLLNGSFSGSFSLPFAPANHTWQNLTSALGPYPGTTVKLNISAWLPWEGGRIDRIASPFYWFNWSKGGGWSNPSLGLEADAKISATPSVLSSALTTLPTATPVNVSLHEPTPNITIDSSIVRFQYSDARGSVSGILPMHPVNQNSTYVVLPGFPSGGRLTFSLLAKDLFGNPLASGNYTYLESGALATNLTPFSSFFYVEAINASTGTLLPGASYTVSNASWSQSAVTGPLGFGVLVIPNGAGTLELPYGTYFVTMTALGHTQTAVVTLGSPTPVTVRFWFANGPVAATSVEPTASLTVALVVGLVLLAAAFVPLFRWFQERQKKAEEERRRVTL